MERATNILIVFKDGKIPGSHFDYYKTVVLQPGSHYLNPKYRTPDDKPSYMLAGGWCNPGENPLDAALRELSEEIRNNEGPILGDISPDQLKPLMTKEPTINGKDCKVTGYVLELNNDQIARIKAHVDLLEGDKPYCEECRCRTLNDRTHRTEVGMTEICSLRKFVADAHLGHVNMIHKGQLGLMQTYVEGLRHPPIQHRAFPEDTEHSWNNPNRLQKGPLKDRPPGRDR